MIEFSDLTKEQLNNIDGGIVVSGTVLTICAVSSFILGGVFGAGVYVGYKNASK